MKPQLRSVLLALLTIMCLTLSIPAFAGYISGPPNGTLGAYFIDNGNSVSNSFFPTTSFLMTGFVFAEWVPAGATPLTVDWAVGTSPFSSDIASGTSTIAPGPPFCLSGAPVGSGFCGNNKGYDVDTSTVTLGSGLFVIAGNNYYLTLTNATDNSGSSSLFDGWDINNGLSLAFDQCGNPHGGLCQAALQGEIPSEAFTILGGGTTPEPGSIMLFGSGILGLAGLSRSKLNR